MTASFNPYREWLGIEAAGSPISHYQLLGLPRGESSEQRIHEAAERATVKVRSQRPGQHASDWARVLDEIQAAKKCLLDPAARATYDRTLAGAAPNLPATPAAGNDSGNAGIRKLLASTPAPRMEIETSSAARDLLPPRPTSSGDRSANPAPPIGNPVPAVSNPAPIVGNPAPIVINPASTVAPVSQTTASPASFNPAPYVSPAMNVAPPLGSNYSAEVASSGWNPPGPAPAMPWAATMSNPSASAQDWRPATPSPMAPAPAYGYSSPGDPMAPATYGAPMNYAPPGSLPMASSPMMPVAMAMTAAPYAAANPMDPMAPTYGGATSYGAAMPYAAALSPMAPAYAAPDPMQAFALPAGTYAPPAEPLSPMAAVMPAAANYGASPMSLGIGPPQSAAPVAMPVGTAAAGRALGDNPGAAPANPYSPVRYPGNAATSDRPVAIRATRSRGGNNLLLLVGAGGGVALLLFAVVMVLSNQQPKPQSVAQVPPDQQSTSNPNPGIPARPGKPVPSPGSRNGSNGTSAPETPIPEPEMKPDSSEPAKPEPVRPETTPEPSKPEPANPDPPKPEPAKPQPEPAKPVKDSVKPTKEQLQELSKLLTQARQAVRELKFDEANASLSRADELPKLEEQHVVLDRLRQLAMHAAAYRQAFQQGKDKLAVGQTLKVTASTQPEIVELDAEKITISNKGEKRSYELASLPQGLFYAVADSAFEPGDVQQKVQRGAYMIAVATDAKDAEKGKALWEEAIEGGAPLTLLLAVVNDKYDAGQLEALAMVEPPASKPEPMPAPSGKSPPSTKSRPGNAAAALPLLKRTRDEISGHQFGPAQATLAQAKPLLANDEQEAKHLRLTLLLDYTRQFKEAIDRTLARQESGNTFEVGKTVVAVVEVRPREIVVRVNGSNRTYQRNELPIGMAVALGDMSLQKDTPEAKLIRGAYVVACSNKPEEIEKAKAWWQEASRSVDVKALLPVITDTYTR